MSNLNIYYNNDFALGIYGGLKLDRNRIELSHGQVYSIHLENNRSTMTEVELKIDGQSVGFFLLDPYQKIEVEHPVGLNRKFTFFQLDQLPQSNKAKLVSRFTNGLIEAIFNPSQSSSDQKKVNFKSFNHRGMVSKDFYDQKEGMTAFTIPSRQKFDTYTKYYFNDSDKTKIRLRLVGKPRYNPLPYHYHYHTTPYPTTPYHYSTTPYQWTSNPTPVDFVDLPSTTPVHHHTCHHCCHCQCQCSC